MKRMHYRTKGRIAWEPDGEIWSNVHLRADCQGRNCVVHNPSNHSMVNWPRHMRETGLVERICPHGIGHPDPDSVAWLNKQTRPEMGWGMHGCDGCCAPNDTGKVTKEGLDLS